MAEPTWIHGPSSAARTQTELVAHCQVCGTTWQIRSPNLDDSKGCSFCNGPASAVTIVSESPRYHNQIINR